MTDQRIREMAQSLYNAGRYAGKLAMKQETNNNAVCNARTLPVKAETNKKVLQDFIRTASHDKKVEYAKSCLLVLGYKLVNDQKYKVYYHVLDTNNHDLTGPKTIDSIIEWLEPSKT